LTPDLNHFYIPRRPVPQKGMTTVCEAARTLHTRVVELQVRRPTHGMLNAAASP
jgi:hypothetical protein